MIWTPVVPQSLDTWASHLFSLCLSDEDGSWPLLSNNKGDEPPAPESRIQSSYVGGGGRAGGGEGGVLPSLCLLSRSTASQLAVLDSNRLLCMKQVGALTWIPLLFPESLQLPMTSCRPFFPLYPLSRHCLPSAHLLDFYGFLARSTS